MLGGEKAAVAFHGDHRPASIYSDGQVIYEPMESTQEGTMLTFDRTYNDRAEVSVFGESVQDGTPTPDNPVPIVSRASACVETSNADGSKTSTTDLTSILDGRELRSLPDGTRDEVQVRDNGDGTGDVVLVERVGVYRPSGNTGSVSIKFNGDGVYFQQKLSGLIVYGNTYLLKNKQICTHFIEENPYMYYDNCAWIFSQDVSNFTLFRAYNKDYTTVQEYKDFFTNNNVQVFYQQRNPVTTVIGTIDLPETFYDTTHIWEANGADISANVKVIP